MVTHVPQALMLTRLLQSSSSKWLLKPRRQKGAPGVQAPTIIAQPAVQWRMSTAWTNALEHLQSTARLLGRLVDEMSGGRFRIEVFPGGQIMQPFDCFKATSDGTIQAFMSSSTYWADREPAAPGQSWLR